MRSNAVALNPEKYREETCAACGAPIFWAFTPGRHKVPMDARAVKFGIYVVVGSFEGLPQLARRDDADSHEDRFIRHSRICEGAS